MSDQLVFSNFENIRAAYSDQGYFAIQSFIPPHLISQMENFVRHIFSLYKQENEDIDETCIRLNATDPDQLYMIYQTISRSIAIDKIRVHCEEIFRAVFPEKILIELGAGLLMGIPQDERIAYDWHQEIHYHTELENVIHTWIPIIHKADLSNGTMSVLSGSHNLGKLPYIKKPKLNPKSVTNLIIQNTDQLKQNCPEQFAIAAPGDVVGLHSYIVHRSNTNTGKKVRFIISLRVAAVDKCPSTFDFKVKE